MSFPIERIDDQDGIYFDGADPGRLILWEDESPGGRELEISDGEQTVVMPLSWLEIER